LARNRPFSKQIKRVQRKNFDHLTNSKIMGPFVQSQQDAWKYYDKLAQDPRVIFLSEPPGFEAAFRPTP